jgi:hypothetical protein
MSPSKAKTARVHALSALATDADDALLLLDLPDLVLDRMLEELFPVSLAAMACIWWGSGTVAPWLASGRAMTEMESRQRAGRDNRSWCVDWSSRQKNCMTPSRVPATPWAG